MNLLFFTSLENKMKNFLFILPLFLILFLSEQAFAEEEFSFPPYFTDFKPSTSERQLLEQGFVLEPYPLFPFGYKYYFSYHDDFINWSEHGGGICAFSATYLLREGDSVNVILKFPTDLIWAGSHDTSGFFLGRGGSHSYVDAEGNAVRKNTQIQWEKLHPSIDSEFITLEYHPKDEITHLLVTKNGLPEPPSPEYIKQNCPMLSPVMKYDYYDRVNSIQRQKELGGYMGFAPDMYICQGNLIGAIKAADGTEVCVKPVSKIKLVERGWAKDFSDYEKQTEHE